MSTEMVRVILPTLALALGLLIDARAAESVDMTVQGAVMPIACEVSLSNGGVVDYGNVFAKDLGSTVFTRLGDQTVTVTLICDSAAKVAIVATDGRSGTAVPGIARFLFQNQDDSGAFGVGSVGGKKIGAYILHRLNRGTGDGQAVTSIWSDNDGVTWSSVAGSGNALSPTGRLHGWAVSGMQTPGYFLVIAQSYILVLGLNKKDDLPALTDAVPIDGLATLTIRYF